MVDLLEKSAVREVPSDEQQLVKRMLAGDDEAFSVLYERYFDQLYGFIFKRVGHREVAEDLLSLVFEKAFANRNRFEWQGVKFSAWLYTIATNSITDHWRTKKPSEDLEQAELVKDQHPGPAEQTEQNIEHARIQLVLEQLPERERLCITLKYYGGLENPEIAEKLGLTPNNVGVILHRSLKKCQQLFLVRQDIK